MRWKRRIRPGQWKVTRHLSGRRSWQGVARLSRMIFGIIPIRFRFRGKLRRLAQIYQCFIDHPGIGLHPMQVARYTGIGFQEVSTRLEVTPELFVKLPKRADGITRYRLTSATAARSRQDVERLLISAARRESFILYAFGAMIFATLLIVVILIAPSL